MGKRMVVHWNSAEIGYGWVSAVTRLVLAFAVMTGGLLSTIPVRADDSPVSFNHEVRPILSQHCLACHGLDAESREADLRLDQRDNAVDALSPGDSDASEVIQRVTSKGEDRMPPPDDHDPLTASEIAVLRQWIQEGANYESHWAFIPPVRPDVPTTAITRDGVESPANAIDHFVRARLAEDRSGATSATTTRGNTTLTPSVTADRATLIRRLSLDITGLPPSPDEVDAFLADESPDAYTRVVERLLESNRFGEHFARYWLDAARYADSNGYFTDEARTLWPWRDWVIHAFNQNMPFDRFTIEQLAGDLLPGADQSTRIATGFNRNHMINNETGIIQEEFRVEYVADRVKTTGTVWMGLTIGCARCHDHKFDPVSQRDFYQFFAFFNNVPEKGLDGSNGNPAPVLRILQPHQQQALAALDEELAAAKKAYVPIEESLRAGQAAWERQATLAAASAPTRGLLLHFPFDGIPANRSDIQFPQDVSFAPGVIGEAVQLDDGKPVEARVSLPIDAGRPFSLGAWVFPMSGAGCVISKTDDDSGFRGFDLSMRKSRLQFHLIHRWKDNAIEVTTRDTVPTSRWQHFFVTYDGSGKAAGVKVFIDGELQTVEINVDNLSASITNSEPLRIGRRKASASFHSRIDDLRIYSRALTDQQVFYLATGQLVSGVTARNRDRRDPHLAKKLSDHYIDHHAPSVSRESRDRLAALEQKRNEFAATIAVTMVMQEMERPREAFVLQRGVYDQHGEAVTAGIPASLGEFPDNIPHNRLGLAQWLTSPNHPLTARVTVNRIWQQLFGTGIVKTADDFGTQGDLPSHPDLLDWLAVEFIDSGWDVKHLVRLIVRSATYRQSSDAPKTEFTADPLNRKLARGPRFRLDAERIRDQALAVSGLLAEKIGGPSVKPYQPPGLWKAVSFDGKHAYEPSTGRDLHRRSLYSYWKRQAPPPNMLAFDAGTRETCLVRRSRTNTPLQALVLMNDPVFVEAAQHLARRILEEFPDAPASERSRFAFRLATARFPDATELGVLTSLYERQLRHFQSEPDAARQLLVFKKGSDPVAGTARRVLRTTGSDPFLNAAAANDRHVELAAWTTVANLILCLDETITRR